MEDKPLATRPALLLADILKHCDPYGYADADEVERESSIPMAEAGLENGKVGLYREQMPAAADGYDDDEELQRKVRQALSMTDWLSGKEGAGAPLSADDRVRLRIALDHWSATQFGERYTLPDPVPDVIDIAFTESEDGRWGLYVSYDMRSRCYVSEASDGRFSLTRRDPAPIEELIDDLRWCDFGDMIRDCTDMVDAFEAGHLA